MNEDRIINRINAVEDRIKAKHSLLGVFIVLLLFYFIFVSPQVTRIENKLDGCTAEVQGK